MKRTLPVPSQQPSPILVAQPSAEIRVKALPDDELCAIQMLSGLSGLSGSRCRELHALLEHCREAIGTRRESIAPRHDQPDMPNLLCGAAAHGQQLGGRSRLTTLVIIITTHIGVTGLASYHRYRRIEHVHWITSKHWTGSPPIATVLAAER